MKRIADKLAEWAISAAGTAVIAAMFAMLALMVREAAPLFFPASQKRIATVSLPAGLASGDVVALGVDADLHGKNRAAGIVMRDGRCGFVAVRGDLPAAFPFSRLPGAPESAAILSAQAHDNNKFSVLWDDGTASLYELTIDFSVAAKGSATIDPAFKLVFEKKSEINSVAPLLALSRGNGESHRVVVIWADGTVGEYRLAPGKGLLGRARPAQTERRVRLDRGGTVMSAAMNDEGLLYLGTDRGDLIAVNLSGETEDEIPVETTPAFRDRRAITSLAFLNGGYALAVGDAEGGVSVWFPRREGGEFRLRRSVGWEGGGAPVRAMAISGRDRGFIALDAAGKLGWFYSTTGERLLELPSPAGSPPPIALALNARGDNLATLGADGTVAFRQVDSSYPEAGLAGFFGKLLYEGYERAAYVWQSTAGEPKLSLVPLIWGSVKAAVYALLFATPIALAAAMYLSQFASPAWRARLKPAVEMLAAVPSVVVGFIAALWLAPIMEQRLRFFADNFQYDQRNSLVIAIAMGFAVIPMVFSLAEDAISAVPPSLSAASLALGASKWQTVLRVVLPTASPGIFTAVMLGFGRAVGETMIVLMAAGNTPIISLSPFNGMRTLSANIAVEMPEAPVGGVLYRTLFLCALLLFVMTLAVNAAAELFRRNLRNRYGKV